MRKLLLLVFLAYRYVRLAYYRFSHWLVRRRIEKIIIEVSEASQLNKQNFLSDYRDSFWGGSKRQAISIIGTFIVGISILFGAQFLGLIKDVTWQSIGWLVIGIVISVGIAYLIRVLWPVSDKK